MSTRGRDSLGPAFGMLGLLGLMQPGEARVSTRERKPKKVDPAVRRKRKAQRAARRRNRR